MPPRPRKPVGPRDGREVKSVHPHSILPPAVRQSTDLGVLRDEYHSCLTDIKSLRQHIHEKQVLIDKNSEKLLQLQDSDPEARRAALRAEAIRISRQIEVIKGRINRATTELEWRQKETGGDSRASPNERQEGMALLKNHALLKAARDLLSAQKKKNYLLKKQTVFAESFNKGTELLRHDLQQRRAELATAEKKVLALREERERNNAQISRLQDELLALKFPLSELKELFRNIDERGSFLSESNTPAKARNQLSPIGTDSALLGAQSEIMRTIKQNSPSISPYAQPQKVEKRVSPQARVPVASKVPVKPESFIHCPTDPPANPSPKEYGQSCERLKTPVGMSEMYLESFDAEGEPFNAQAADVEPFNFIKQSDEERDADVEYSPDTRPQAIIFNPPMPLQTVQTPPRDVDVLDPLRTEEKPTTANSTTRPPLHERPLQQVYPVEDEEDYLKESIREEIARDIAKKKGQLGATDEYEADFDTFSDDLDTQIIGSLNATAKRHGVEIERDADGFDFFM
ncbi:hypothetical protein GMRT_11917 [Giardia muris]|uniref:Uncharacterized protein n=1 Tax=Giardia muris TaxID=5742 RepID=A0A4Z1T7R2_GIAMU|nr:hypothetical protein GMRT_11917 [Giardia muris]|eukprot:TNJ28531.1 hypothetical protein GMRT_11917 [Giardia muris]